MAKLVHFYAVTDNSIYRVVVKGENGLPLAIKIALQGGAESKIGVGKTISDEMLSVSRWLLFFRPEPQGWGSGVLERRAEYVNTKYHGPKSSPISALFLNLEDALYCLEESDRVPGDERWREKTLEVVRAIDDLGDESMIVVCRQPGFCIPLLS